MVEALVVERKTLRAFRLLFGRRLAALRGAPKVESPERAQALQALRRAHSNLTAFRRTHPELVGPRARQETLSL